MEALLELKDLAGRCNRLKPRKLKIHLLGRVLFATCRLLVPDAPEAAVRRLSFDERTRLLSAWAAREGIA